MKNVKLILLFFVSTLFFSCQNEPTKSDVDQPTTFANFYVRFMEAERRIKATAIFDQGKDEKNTTSLKIENGVFFHNANMDERKIQKVGIRYSYEMGGRFSDSFKFRFTDPVKGKMNYNLIMNPIHNVSISNGISKSKGMVISWEGNPLNENESLVFLIKGEKGNPIHFEIKGKTETSQISIPAGKTKTLTLGTAKIEIVRKQSIVTEEPNFIAHCNSEFYSSVTDTNVVP